MDTNGKYDISMSEVPGEWKVQEDVLTMKCVSLQLYKGPESCEEVLSWLRRQGCSKFSSIVILRRISGLSSDDVKLMVHHSKTWSDRKATDDDFHAGLNKAIDEYNKEDK